MIVSVTPELALDEGYTYAGGLGILEGDKFYGAGRLGLPYVALTLFYRENSFDYDFDEEGRPMPKPKPQPAEFLDKLAREGSLKVEIGGGEVDVEILKYRWGSAEAVFFNPLNPEWASRLTCHVYVEDSLEEKLRKYTLLSKASAEYVSRFIGSNQVDYMDLQEAYSAFLPIILKIPGKFRLVIHTLGRWGHPSFPSRFFEQEFGYKLFLDRDLLLTDMGLAASKEAFTVSAKHFEVMSKVFPHCRSKLRYVTNGVDVERWMDPSLRVSYESGNLSLNRFIEERERIKKRFAEFIRRYKDIDVEDMILLSWCRRLARYKRPEFVIKAVKEITDRNVLFLLGGRAHPHDETSLEYLRIFHKLHKEHKNVVYIPDYTVSTSKELISSSDLLLFTPSSGWEACGTSYMKAAVNGVPTLSSRDGGTLELIRHGVNGWFFGKDISEIPELAESFSNESSLQDYEEFKCMLKQALDLYKNDEQGYYKVASNSLHTSIPRVSIYRLLKEYYPDMV